MLALKAKVHLCSPVKQHMLRLGSLAAAMRIQSGLYKLLLLIATGFLVLKKADARITQYKFLNNAA